MDCVKWIQQLFPSHTNGYFVEAGAHDGVGDSQTYALEQLGWTGICVEPSSAFKGLKDSRKCHCDNRCLWGASGEDMSFRQVIGNGIEMSHLTILQDRIEYNKQYVEQYGFKTKTVTT